MKRILLVWMLLLFSSIHLFSQNHLVYGKLTTFNKFPVRNVTVFAKKSEATAISDSTGLFSIVCKKKDVLKIKPEAFQNVSLRVGPASDTLLVNLVFIDNESNREVATGYGYIDQADLAYATSFLENENNDFCNYKNIYALMKGKLPGVKVVESAGGGAVYIRGTNSLSASSEALIVVDGMMTDNVGWINPCQVASIDVIKDSMAAMYGSRGGNGVVIIKTKKTLD